MTPQQFRDLTLIPLSAEKNLVIACDSSAGIGEKPYDQVKTAPEIVAAFCVRVPLLELLCFGATPLCVVNSVGNEFQETGARMLAGIKGELAKLALAIPINGSTEENMLTETSSVGVTVIGEIASNQPLPTVACGDMLLQLGEPFVGHEVVSHLATIFSYELVQRLRQETGVKDLLPVGSKGIRYEAETMTQSRCQLKFLATAKNLEKSAGPATVVLVAVTGEQAPALLEKYSMLKKIGEFY